MTARIHIQHTLLVALVALTACAFPMDQRPGTANAIAPASASHAQWRQGARLALRTSSGVVALEYGSDWFAVPGTPVLRDADARIAGHADDLLAGLPDDTRGRVVIALLPAASLDDQMESAARLREVAADAGARGLVLLLPATFGEALVRHATVEIETAADDAGAVAEDGEGIPVLFVRTAPFLFASGLARTPLLDAAEDARIVLGPLPSLRIDASLPLPHATLMRSASR